MTKNKRANSFNTGIAAEYFVLSQLYRMGVEAYISQGNRKAIDIRVVQNDKSISIDVGYQLVCPKLILLCIIAGSQIYFVSAPQSAKPISPPGANDV